MHACAAPLCQMDPEQLKSRDALKCQNARWGVACCFPKFPGCGVVLLFVLKIMVGLLAVLPFEHHLIRRMLPTLMDTSSRVVSWRE